MHVRFISLYSHLQVTVCQAHVKKSIHTLLESLCLKILGQGTQKRWHQVFLLIIWIVSNITNLNIHSTTVQARISCFAFCIYGWRNSPQIPKLSHRRLHSCPGRHASSSGIPLHAITRYSGWERLAWTVSQQQLCLRKWQEKYFVCALSVKGLSDMP